MASPTKDELLAQAQDRGIDVPSDATKADIEALLDGGDAAQPQDQPSDVPTPTSADLGQDVGFVGTKVDPLPNEAYSQETDPTQSPSALDSARITHERAGEALSNPDGSTTEGGE